MALGGDLGGPKVQRFTVDHEKECSKVGIQGQAQSKMGKEGSSRGSKFKKAKYYQQKEKKIVA